MRSTKTTAITSKKLVHPISEADLRRAADILSKNKSGKLLKNLDERCDLNVTFANIVLHRGIMPKKGAGIKRVTNTHRYPTIPKIKQDPGAATTSSDEKINLAERNFKNVLKDTLRIFL